MSNTSANYHEISRISIEREPKSDDNPYEYLYITFTSTRATHTIAVFGAEDTLEIDLGNINAL